MRVFFFRLCFATNKCRAIFYAYFLFLSCKRIRFFIDFQWNEIWKILESTLKYNKCRVKHLVVDIRHSYMIFLRLIRNSITIMDENSIMRSFIMMISWASVLVIDSHWLLHHLWFYDNILLNYVNWKGNIQHVLDVNIILNRWTLRTI